VITRKLEKPLLDGVSLAMIPLCGIMIQSHGSDDSRGALLRGMG